VVFGEKVFSDTELLPYLPSRNTSVVDVGIKIIVVFAYP